MDHVFLQMCPIDFKILDEFDRCKDAFMGMSFAVICKDGRDEEIEFLKETLKSL